MGGGSGIAAKKDETVVAEAEDLIVLGDIYLCEGFLGAVEGYRREFLQVQVGRSSIHEAAGHRPLKSHHHLSCNGGAGGVAHDDRTVLTELLAFELSQLDGTPRQAFDTIELQIVVRTIQRESPLVEIGRSACREGDLRQPGNSRLVEHGRRVVSETYEVLAIVC